jgi:AraC family transcriptional regulator of adaptative response/methylated-DNA-[protein]-cysteine methyltransferase
MLADKVQREFYQALLEKNIEYEIMGGSPAHNEMHRNVLQASWMDTPLGPMIGITDKEHLYLLEFIQRRGLQREIEQLCSKTKSVIVPGEPQPIISIKEELQLYCMRLGNQLLYKA